MADIRTHIPGDIRTDESFEVKTLALAPPLTNPNDEFDAAGLPIPHYVAFEARLADRLAWRIDLGPGVSRNVGLNFFVTADRPSILVLRWTLRDGGVDERSLQIVPR